MADAELRSLFTEFSSDFKSSPTVILNSILCEVAGLDPATVSANLRSIFIEFINAEEPTPSHVDDIVNAVKFIKFGSKNIAKTYSDRMHRIFGTSGRLAGMDVCQDGSIVTITSGKFISNGVVVYSDSDETVVDSGLLNEPYYLYGYVNNDATAHVATFGLTEDTTNSDYALLAVKNSSNWASTPAMELGLLWKDLTDHVDNDSLHSTASLNLSIAADDQPTSMNPYATEDDLKSYDESKDINSIVSMINALIELEQHDEKYYLNNFFADTIPMDNQPEKRGKYDTFLSVADSNIGQLGVYNDSTGTEYTFTTPVIAQFDTLVDYIVVSPKELKLDTTSYITVDIMTDDSSYELTDQYVNAYIPDATSLSTNPAGLYNLKLRFSIPAVTGGDYHTVKTSIPNSVSSCPVQSIGNRIFIVGGRRNDASDPGIQVYNHINDTASVFINTIDKKLAGTSKFEHMNRIHIYNSNDTAGAMDSSIKEISLSNKSVFSVATGLSLRGGISNEFSQSINKAFYGTGNDIASVDQNDWKEFNQASYSSSTKIDYPVSVSSVCISGSLISNYLYMFGSSQGGIALEEIRRYDPCGDSFLALAPTISGGRSTTMSLAEGMTFTLMETAIISAMASGTAGSDLFHNDCIEWHMANNTISARTDMILSYGHAGVILGSDGKIYSLGGASGTSSPNSAEDYCYQYTPNAFHYLYGWGVSWH